MSKHGRLGVGILATALIRASGGAALARAGGYTIGPIAVQPKSIESQPTGQKHPRFRITLHGTAMREEVLDVYLDWEQDGPALRVRLPDQPQGPEQDAGI